MGVSAGPASRAGSVAPGHMLGQPALLQRRDGVEPSGEGERRGRGVQSKKSCSTGLARVPRDGGHVPFQEQLARSGTGGRPCDGLAGAVQQSGRPAKTRILLTTALLVPRLGTVPSSYSVQSTVSESECCASRAELPGVQAGAREPSHAFCAIPKRRP